MPVAIVSGIVELDMDLAGMGTLTLARRQGSDAPGRSGALAGSELFADGNFNC